LAEAVSLRLEKYIVADDVQVVNVAAIYGLLSVQGPKAGEVLSNLGLFGELPARAFQFRTIADANLGEIYLINRPRGGTGGFDLFVPATAQLELVEKLVSTAKAAKGCLCGWQALEMARIEAGIPRFGVDMDANTFPQECGIESQTVSYTKGCYIGQEVLNRIHTQGHVNRELRGLRLADDLSALPVKGDKLLRGSKDVGMITSALASPALKANFALGYVRREANQIGAELLLRSSAGESTAKIIELPFRAG